MTTLCQTSFLQTLANKASEWFFVDLILSCKKTNEIWWNIMATVTVTQLKDLIHQHINVCITYVCKTRVTKYVDGTPMSLSSTSAHPTMVTLVNIMVMNRWLTSFSFNINQPSHSWDTAISNSDIETPRSRSWIWSKCKVVQLAQYPIYSLPFHFTSIRSTIPEIQLFGHLTLKHPRSRLWVTSYVNVTYYTQYPTDAFHFLFHINRTNHSWDMAKIVFNL